MNYHNIRFPKMWDIISSKIDFTDKIVIDAGCGYGDFAYTVAQQAQKVYAFEKDIDICGITTAKYGHQKNLIFVCQEDIDQWSSEWYPLKNTHSVIHYLTCFSVLPYLKNPTETLRLFREMARVILLEVQYKDDGPGFEHIKSDIDMYEWLKMCGYSKADAIGKTLIDGRDKWHTIWECS